MAAWHYQKDGSQLGPISSQQLKNLAASGQLLPTDLVWKEGMAGWSPASKVSGLFSAPGVSPVPPPLPVSPPPIPAQCNVVSHSPQLPPQGSAASFGTYFESNKKLLTAGAAGGALLLVMVVIGLVRFSGGDNAMNGRGDSDLLAEHLESGQPFAASTPDRRDGQRATANSATTLPGTIEPLLPEELTPQAGTAQLPLSNLRTFVEGHSGTSQDGPFVHFSSTGKFALVLYRDGRGVSTRLWNCDSDSEVKATSSGAFSYPAAFSPDNQQLACIDGEVLRIWSLKADSAELLQSLPVTAPGNASSHVGWTGLQWTEKALIASHRTAHRDRFFHVLKESSSGEVEAGTTTGFRNAGGDDYETFDALVAPNGQFLVRVARSWDDAKFYLLASDISTGAQVSKIELPEGDLQYDQFATPSCSALGRVDPSTYPDAEQASCLLLSPDSRYVAISMTEKGRRRPLVLLLSTDTWKFTARIESEHEGAAQSKPQRVTDLAQVSASESFLRCFSQDGRTVVTTDVESREDTSIRWLVLCNTANGDRIRKIEAGTFHVSLDEDVSFSPDGQSIVIADVFALDAEGEQLTMFRVQGWDMNGQPIAPAFSRMRTTSRAQSLSLSPDNLILLTLSDGVLRVWDTDRLRELHRHVALGDRAWSAGDRIKAIEHYRLVFQDGWAWQVESIIERDFARMLSRCFDVYAKREEAEKLKGLIVYLQHMEIPLEPETHEGKSFLQEFVAEQRKQERHESQQQRATAEQRLAEIRRMNQARSVAGQVLSKRQFVEKMREVMDRGQIDQRMQYAIFENHSFQDVFGDPDSNVGFGNSERLISYRCADGAIQLKVVFGGLEGETTIVQEVNEY